MTENVVAICLASPKPATVNMRDGPAYGASTYNQVVLYADWDGNEDCAHDQWLYPSVHIHHGCLNGLDYQECGLEVGRLPLVH
jgi:hypothetical protein